MRTSDIWQAKQNPRYIRDENMYINEDKPIDQMSLDELQRVLCGKANGDVLACEACETKCKFGRRIVELLKPVEKQFIEVNQEVEHKTEDQALSGRGKKTGAIKREAADVAYLQAIASGNPVQWFIDNGRDVRNCKYRMKQRFGNMTAEEARERLVAKGIETTEEPNKKVVIDPLELITVTPASEPVEHACSKLKIAALDGEFCHYSRKGNAVCINFLDMSINIKFDEINAFCEEVKSAAELLMK